MSAAAHFPERRIEVEIDAIRRDPRLQLRAGPLDLTHVDHLAELMRDEDPHPIDPIALFYDGEVYWLADGWHRLAAAERVAWDTIEADIHGGGFREALLYAAGANAKHGKPITNADKRRAVGALLDQAEQEGDESALDTPSIAAATFTTRQFVNKLKRERAAERELEAELAPRRERIAERLRVLVEAGHDRIGDTNWTLTAATRTLPECSRGTIIALETALDLADQQASAETVSAPPAPPDPLAERRAKARTRLRRLQAEGYGAIPGSITPIAYLIQFTAMFTAMEDDLRALEERLDRADRLEEERRRSLVHEIGIILEHGGSAVTVGDRVVPARADLAWSTRLRDLRGLEESVEAARGQLGTLPPRPAAPVLENPTPAVERPQPWDVEFPHDEEWRANVEAPPAEPDPRQIQITAPVRVSVPDPVGGIITLSADVTLAEIRLAILRVQERCRARLADAQKLAGRVVRALNQARRAAHGAGLDLLALRPNGEFWDAEGGETTLVRVKTEGEWSNDSRKYEYRAVNLEVRRKVPQNYGDNNGRIMLHLREEV